MWNSSFLAVYSLHITSSNICDTFFYHTGVQTCMLECTSMQTVCLYCKSIITPTNCIYASSCQRVHYMLAAFMPCAIKFVWFLECQGQLGCAGFTKNGCIAVNQDNMFLVHWLPICWPHQLWLHACFDSWVMSRFAINCPTDVPSTPMGHVYKTCSW